MFSRKTVNFVSLISALKKFAHFLIGILFPDMLNSEVKTLQQYIQCV